MFPTSASLSFYSSHGFATVGRPATGAPGKGNDESIATVHPATSPGAGDGEDANGSTTSLADLLKPAVNAPPSPERLRAVSKQAKMASTFDSGSTSSLKSTATDRPSWEAGAEQITLSRRSSSRSTASKPSRDRPESVQIFGKTIFNRIGKMGRDSSANSSSESSLHSGDMTVDSMAASPIQEQQPLPSIFGRRKAAKSDASIYRPRSNSANSRKLLISNPYNFQHITHTRRDQLPNLHEGSRVDMMSDFSAVRSAPPPPRGAGSVWSPEMSPGTEGHKDDGSQQPPPPTVPILPSSSSQPTSPLRRSRVNSLPRRLLMRSQSSERLSVVAPLTTPRSGPPPRPPRSPAETSSSPMSSGPPIPPPPRMSSRTSARLNGLDPLVTQSSDRPQTSGGFRQPQPFSPPVESSEPPATAHGYPEHAEHPDDAEDYPDSPFSHALTTPDDAAWPLSSNTATFAYDAALPDVPEEDENNHAGIRRSRLSFTSNKSSLRGSHSVPLLRQSAQLQGSGHQRYPSGASDTLGLVDASAARGGTDSAVGDDPAADVRDRGSWEDDIDYCYEHEADADFDYAWERPSFDVSRDVEAVSPTSDGRTETRDGSRQPAVTEQEQLGETEDDRFIGLMPVPATHSEIPALSPQSPAPSVNAQEAITPVLTLATDPVETDVRNLANKQDGHRKSAAHLHVRTSSRASSFKESHGFTLSPSLLIPGDFHQQMVMARTNTMDSYPDDLPSPGGPGGPSSGFGDSSPMVMGASAMFINDRASTATSRSNSSVQTGSSAGRHVSMHSSFTAHTRYTGSTMFEGWDPKAAESAEPMPAVQLDDFAEVTPQADSYPGVLKGPSSDSGGRPGHAVSQSVGNIQNMNFCHDLAQPAQQSQQPQRAKGKEPAVRQRKRAHTTSLSSPHGGGYALFPPAYTGNRI